MRRSIYVCLPCLCLRCYSRPMLCSLEGALRVRAFRFHAALLSTTRLTEAATTIGLFCALRTH